MVNHINRPTALVIRGELLVQLAQLQLLEGQDLSLAREHELFVGSIWGSRLGSHSPLAD